MRGPSLVTLYWIGLSFESRGLLEESSKDVLGYRRCKIELLGRVD
jgi:hypothetical protein